MTESQKRPKINIRPGEIPGSEPPSTEAKPKIVITPESDLSTVQQFIEETQRGELRECVLPVGVNFVRLVHSLGNVKRDFELGGDYDPSSRLIRVRRSETQHAHGFVAGEALVFSEYFRRKDIEGKIVGEMWHTHPWASQESVYRPRYKERYREELNCCPSEQDNTLLFLVGMTEEEEGTGRTFSETISAAGFVSETRTAQVDIKEDKLREIGCSEKAIQQLLAYVGLLPAEHRRNFAQDEKREEFFAKLVAYYRKKALADGSFSRDIDTFIHDVKDLLVTYLFDRQTLTATEKLKGEMLHTFAAYPDRRKLQVFGFNTKEQQDAVLSMLGMTTDIYALDEEGNKVPVLSGIYSCDTIDAVIGLNPPQTSPRTIRIKT